MEEETKDPLFSADSFNRAITKLVIVEYAGPVDEIGLPHGEEGVAKFLDGQTFTGSFVDGQMHGQGLFLWPDSTRYEGEVAHNELTGNGQLFWSNGSHFQGEVKQGLRHGYGVFLQFCCKEFLCW